MSIVKFFEPSKEVEVNESDEESVKEVYSEGLNQELQKTPPKFIQISSEHEEDEQHEERPLRQSACSISLEVKDSGISSNRVEDSKDTLPQSVTQDYRALSQMEQCIIKVGANFTPKNRDETLRYILNRMAKSYEMDLELATKSQPAVHKILYSKKLVKQLKDKITQNLFLANDGLNFLSLWLEKTINGIFPSNEVQEAVLEICGFLPITPEHLQGTRLGRQVKNLEKNANTKNLKEMATKVLHKWYKSILDLGNECKSQSKYEEKYLQYRTRKLQEAAIVSNDKDPSCCTEDTNPSKMKMEAKGKVGGKSVSRNISVFDLTYRPVANLEGNAQSGNKEGAKNQIMKNISQMHKSSLKSSKKYGYMSRAWK
ncbi:unnamed protein product [Moneuplotes crassus]|uniref:TFIIS N-terminal domain-containing protein n=1 Tax=Euplotes crassus TaxID=5936 RepID=A0AAD1UNF3_EUPCR|nr:unnamed protein product [Moneuplotes crassus]